jgi:hypothetical protein
MVRTCLQGGAQAAPIPQAGDRHLHRHTARQARILAPRSKEQAHLVTGFMQVPHHRLADKSRTTRNQDEIIHPETLLT